MEKNELELFPEVLTDPENDFAISLKLALKESASLEVFEHIKNTFEMEMDNEVFNKIMLTK